MTFHPDHVGRFVVGAVLIALGAVLLVENTGLVQTGSLHQLWPMFIILLGIAQLVRPGHRRGGAWLAFIGVLLLLHTTHTVLLRDSWPLFIVAVGVGILWRSLSPGGRTRGCADSYAGRGE